LHFTWLLVRLAKLIEVKLNCDFLLVKHEIELEKIVHGHHRDRVHVAVASQECSEFFVGGLDFIPIVEFDDIEVLLSIVELVLVITQQSAVLLTINIPLLSKVVAQEEHTGFEWLIVDKRQQIGLAHCVLNKLFPDALMSIFSEQHVVDRVVKPRVV
jgi:hypothetical protein